ncbi:brefeldin A-inhibited guanine nucleotide-exchange protein 1-like [Salvia splendens]|uniref:brefeldin A-inhibited guanine nucleotide-exchange protein 1-like n=1 Tax=Salvia splendens TaxID=180675 RepID=UPI001C258F43|nr:brefeldin A-inhibited guanine nucleotide-exchange protein 1-like [Salvia splendens]
MTLGRESIKSQVRIIKSTESWMDQQLKDEEHNPTKSSDNENVAESPSYHTDDAANADFELHLETKSEMYDAATLEQRRAHKLEIQVVTDIYKIHWKSLSANTVTTIVLGIFSSISSHSYDLNTQTMFLLKLDKACSVVEISGPPLVHFENGSYKSYLNFLHDVLVNIPHLCRGRRMLKESLCLYVGRVEYV